MWPNLVVIVFDCNVDYLSNTTQAYGTNVVIHHLSWKTYELKVKLSFTMPTNFEIVCLFIWTIIYLHVGTAMDIESLCGCKFLRVSLHLAYDK